MLAGIAITQASGRSLSRSRLIRCGGIAAVIAIMLTTNTPISRKGAPRIRWPTEALGALDVMDGFALGDAGAPRSKPACSGAHTSRCSAASTHSACRQPSVAISPADSGINTVLARPPRNVSVMMARRKSCGKRRVTTAKTGLYSVAASAAPSTSHTA